MSSPSERLAELGLTLPGVAAPLAAYVPAVRVGDLVYTSGQLPSVEGKLVAAGKVGGEVSPETAAALADGVRERCAATWGIGLTGVAGPDPVDGHGPGRVYLGLSDGARTDVVRLDLRGDRAAVSPRAVRTRASPNAAGAT